MKLKTISLVTLAILLNIVSVFSLGGAFDIAAGLGYADPLNPAFRGMAGVLGVAALVLALRIWFRAFGIKLSPGPASGTSDDSFCDASF